MFLGTLVELFTISNRLCLSCLRRLSHSGKPLDTFLVSVELLDIPTMEVE